jgi:hypothetical protein
MKKLNFTEIRAHWDATMRPCIEELSARLGERGYDCEVKPRDLPGINGFVVSVYEKASHQRRLALEFVLYDTAVRAQMPGVQSYIGVLGPDNVLVEFLPRKRQFKIPQSLQELYDFLGPCVHAGFLYQFCVARFELPRLVVVAETSEDPQDSSPANGA